MTADRWGIRPDAGAVRAFAQPGQDELRVAELGNDGLAPIHASLGTF